MTRALVFLAVVAAGAGCFFLGHVHGGRRLIGGSWWPVCAKCGDPIAPDFVDRIRTRREA